MAITTRTHIEKDTIEDRKYHQWIELSSNNTYRTSFDKKYEITKRVIDVTVSLCVVLFVLSWLIPIISLFIFLSSRGPIFFIQVHLGKNGKQFTSLKFRTVYYDDEKTVFQRKNDIRITPFGRFLRRTNLDEMTLFFNVLLGDMSVVGPRPQNLIYTANVIKLFGFREYMLRFSVKPGMVSLSDVCIDTGRENTERWIRNEWRYDSFYVMKRSIGLDLKIMFLALMIGLRGHISEW